MLRFDGNKRSRPPATLSRGMQLRMMSLVAGLALVLGAMNQLRKPEGAAALERVLNGGQTPVVEQDIAVGQLPDPLLAAEALATIEDNTFFRKEESAAWFSLLVQLRDGELPAASAPGPLTYAQLTRQPQVYRGRPVRVAGTVRRVERTKPGENDVGIESLYRIILQGQGGETWPTTLYALEPPTDTPLGETVNVPVEVTGVFFKNWSYRHETGLGISPVLLTKGVTPLVSPAVDAKPIEFPMWQLFAIAGGIAAVMLLFVWRRTKPEPATDRAPSSVDFSHLNSGPEDA